MLAPTKKSVVNTIALGFSSSSVGSDISTGTASNYCFLDTEKDY